MAAPIGLIAGSGRMPFAFARAAARAGRRVVAVAHEGETDPTLAQAVDQLSWVKLGQLGKVAQTLREAGCTEASLCGGISKVRLFDVRPDGLGLKALASLRSFGDDAALRAVAAALESSGLRLVAPTDVAPELLAAPGKLSRRGLSEVQRKDAAVGLRVARALGTLDVGQTVVVHRGVVLAVEALEGTDACIARAGALAKGGVVVKARKPMQDARFDLPAVGPGTIRALVSAGCAALAIEAGAAVVLDADELSAAADRDGIAVEAL